MGSSKRSAAVAGKTAAKDKHKKAHRMLYDPKAPLPAGLVAKPTIPKLKHRTYYEIMENRDKKKKLEFEITTKETPPPGFEFVPMGNPALTTACKELSREKDALIFIVSNLKDPKATSLSHQVHRIGHHVRQSIVEEAKARFDVFPAGALLPLGAPEPIPLSQAQYNAQVDAALRDLFPRIPNTDRQIIIEHAFDLKAKARKGEKPVGLSTDITLARRVQLAVLAHIRHTHTRYDELRKETSWINARRVVETLCLDILVKWRGDEESGRDQLDEILQEVVVISDSEEIDDDDEVDLSSEDSDSSIEILSSPPRPGALLAQPPTRSHRSGVMHRTGIVSDAQGLRGPRARGKKEQRGFKRYQAWQDAIQRNRAEDHSSGAQAMRKSVSHGAHPQDASGSNSFPVGTRPPPARVNEWQDSPNEFPASQPYQISGQEVYHERIPLGQPLRMESLPPQRPHSPPIQDRFKDLLVRSIEPLSPEVTQPSFVRTVPSKSPDPRHYFSAQNESPHHRYPGGPSGNTVFASPHDPPQRRVISDQGLQASDFPGGFIQVSHRDPAVGHHLQPPRVGPEPRQGLGDPLLGQSRVRPRDLDFLTDHRPAKRTLLEAAPITRAADQFYMEDRGGFLEKVPLHPHGSRSVPPDPGFIEIRRAQPAQGFEADRVVSRDEGRRLRHEPGIEVIPISSSPLASPDHAVYRESRPVHHFLDHSLSHGPPPAFMPMEQSMPLRVFRHVRGNGPGASHHPIHPPHGESIPPYHGPPPPREPAYMEDQHQLPIYDVGPDGRPLGRYSYTPIVLD